VHAPALEILRRGGALDHVTVARTLDEAAASLPSPAARGSDPVDVLTHPG
jgi:hypothetical protein